MTYETVVHTIPPLYAADSRVLILGSIPSPKSRETAFFYGHPHNRYWRVLAQVLDEASPQSIEEKRALCMRHKIAMWDVLASCDIMGAGDSTIRNPVPNDLAALIQKTQVHTVFATGQKAAALYRKYCEQSTGLPVIALPSTSPANAAWSFERLCTAYHQITSYLSE